MKHGLLNFFLAVFSSCALASAEIPSEVKSVKLVTGANYFPFISDSLPRGGWSTAVVESVFSHIGYEAQIDILPWARGAKWTLEHNYVGTFPYVYSDERNEKYLYSLPINYVPIRLFSSATTTIKSLEDIHNKSLCLPMGYTISQSINSIKAVYSLTVNRAKDMEACFGHVAKGWSDLGVINGHFSQQYIRDVFHQSSTFNILSDPLDTVSLHFIVARSLPNSQQWIKSFNKGLNELAENGRLAEIEAQFLTVLNNEANTTVQTK